MTDMHFVASGRRDSLTSTEHGSAKPLTFAQTRVLERAVAKIVLLGKQVGVSADEMIRLLNSGLTVGELLEYLVMRAGHAC